MRQWFHSSVDLLQVIGYEPLRLLEASNLMKINLIRAETREQIDNGPGVIGARGFAVDHSGFHLFTFNVLQVYLTVFYGT